MDRCQWRAQFMAHRRQEFSLRLARGLRLAARIFHLGFVCLDLCDVDLHRDEAAVFHAPVVGSNPAAVLQMSGKRPFEVLPVGSFTFQIVGTDIVADCEVPCCTSISPSLLKCTPGCVSLQCNCTCREKLDCRR